MAVVELVARVSDREELTGSIPTSRPTARCSSSCGPATTTRGATCRSTQLEASGQHEVLNWVCLAGAMAELGAKMELVDWVETWIFNAPKCQAIFR